MDHITPSSQRRLGSSVFAAPKSLDPGFRRDDGAVLDGVSCWQGMYFAGLFFCEAFENANVQAFGEHGSHHAVIPAKAGIQRLCRTVVTGSQLPLE
jgi:hypothetical protein